MSIYYILFSGYLINYFFIFSLLRRQDSLRRASSEGDQEQSDQQSESSTEQGSFVETVKITVV